MASSDLSDHLPKVGPAAHNERRDGWCGGVHFLNYPNHLNFKLPRGFHKRLSLKLLVLATQIPVACVGVLTNLGHALKFSIVPLHGLVVGTRGSPWQELSSADSPATAPPGTTLPPSLPAP